MCKVESLHVYPISNFLFKTNHSILVFVYMTPCPCQLSTFHSPSYLCPSAKYRRREIEMSWMEQEARWLKSAANFESCFAPNQFTQLFTWYSKSQINIIKSTALSLIKIKPTKFIQQSVGIDQTIYLVLNRNRCGFSFYEIKYAQIRKSFTFYLYNLELFVSK